jgi:fructoselysine/glucoselysine PTS system EIIA component
MAKTRKFLIATHGAFAKGVHSSLELIIGSIENIYLIQAYIDGNTSIGEEVATLLTDAGEDEEWVIFCDLLGGSITNQILQVGLRENVHIVAGFNLPVLLEVLLADADSPVEEVIEQGIFNAREQLVYVNKLITQKKGEDIHD